MSKENFKGLIKRTVSIEDDKRLKLAPTIEIIKGLHDAKEFKSALDLAESLKKQYPDNTELLKLIDSIYFGFKVDGVKQAILEDKKNKSNIDYMIESIDEGICGNEESDYKIKFMNEVIKQIHLSNNSTLAQKYAERFLKNHPENVELLYLLGSICFETGDTAKSIKYNEKAMHLENETKSPQPKRDNKPKKGSGGGGSTIPV